MKYLLIILLILTSCGPQHYLRKAARAIKKAEEKGAVWKVDTVFKTIEVPVPQVRTDTVFKAQVGDTVIIEKDRLKIKYVRLAGDSVFIQGESKSDTVEVMVPVTVNREISAKKRSWTFYVAWALILIIAGFITGYLVRGRVRKDLTIKFDREKPEDIK